MVKNKIWVIFLKKVAAKVKSLIFNLFKGVMWVKLEVLRDF